ncbi:dihydropteroate synthase [candidate division TA06 bacterium]|nr:dihydropteroate synthase [candidate division TA06 bacterium]
MKQPASRGVQVGAPSLNSRFVLPHHTLDLSRRTLIMGVLNVTPDSFSDGGSFFDPERAEERGMKMEEEGADLIDIGGESTRPNSDPVSVEEELHRVLPVIEGLRDRVRIPLSIDTYKSEVAREALQAGAELVNDISGIRFDQAMAETIAGYGAGLVISHIKGRPQNMQQNPYYDDVIGEIKVYLEKGLEKATEEGIEGILVDPGIGFGKRTEDNLVILRRLREFQDLGRPLLVGPSRKSFIGTVLDLPVEERLEGTAAAVAIAVLNGASMIRVHDVKEMVRVVRMVDAIKNS